MTVADLTVTLPWLPSLLVGASTTFLLAVLAWIAALPLGLIIAAARLSGGVIALAARSFVVIVRALPELLLLFLVADTSGTLLAAVTPTAGTASPSLPLAAPPFAVALVTLTLIVAAQAAETIRGALLSVSTDILDGARALGSTETQTLLRVRVPAAWPIARPSLAALAQSSIKASGYVSAIGVVDLLRVAATAAGSTSSPFLFYGLAAALYLALGLIVAALFAALGRRPHRVAH